MILWKNPIFHMTQINQKKQKTIKHSHNFQKKKKKYFFELTSNLLSKIKDEKSKK